MSAGITNSPASTPFLSEVKDALNVGPDELTDVILPFAFADPAPWETSPALNAPVCDTVRDPKSPVLSPSEKLPVAMVPEMLLIVKILLLASNAWTVAVAVCVVLPESEKKVIPSPTVGLAENAPDNVTCCVKSETNTVDEFWYNAFPVTFTFWPEPLLSVWVKVTCSPAFVLNTPEFAEVVFAV